MFLKPNRKEWRMAQANKSLTNPTVNNNCLGEGLAVDLEVRLHQLSKILFLQIIRRGLFDRGGRSPPEPPGKVVCRDEEEIALPLLNRGGDIYHQLRNLVPEVEPPILTRTVLY